uniref:Ubiquitin carboxyl-terminal hydrolase n=1 Tax=Syphacia muris TaxID=451379 RepID=A0A0N5AHE3_9BILA
MKINVKWGREKLEVDADLSEPPLVFKSQLFALTGVMPERQKVMIKGKTLGDESWSGIQLTEGAQIMMMGSADAVPEAPKERVQFVEDMTEAQASAAQNLPVGLKNLGNTCYMNATLQCFKAIPELLDAILNFKGGAQSLVPSEAGASTITGAVRDLYRMMESDSSKRIGSVIPLYMVQALHTVLPQFSARDDHGHWMQQDANECWTELLRKFQTQLSTSDGASPTTSVVTRFMEGSFNNMKTNPIFHFFICFGRCLINKFFQLSCFLNQEVKYVQLGIKSKLTEEIEKHSELLCRNGRYEKKALINRLPGYLCIQMVRFFYKEKDKVNAKILKDVKFPLRLDMFDMCDPELQQKLIPMRDAFKDDDEKKLEALRLSKTEGVSKEEPKVPEKEIKYASFSFSDDPGSNNSGFYDLQAVLTHKGRSSNSGHYVAWVRVDGDRWAMCNDDEVHPVSSEDIIKLSGGGDWHCAYLLLYGPRRLQI